MAEGRHAALDRADVTAVLFHPRSDGYGLEDSPGLHSVRIPVAKGISVAAKIFVAAADAPLILYFHGNGEIASDYDEISRIYNHFGFSLLVVDYRGYGGSDGQPDASSLIADAMPVYNGVANLMTERGLAFPSLYVMGRSLGSAPALEVASRVGEDISGLIIESGFAFTVPLIERLGGSAAGLDEDRDGFRNLAKMEKVTVPTLVIHGESDWVIPVQDGLALHGHCRAADKRLLTVPNAGHNDLLMMALDRYFGAIHELAFGKEPVG
ncbi:MAG: lysophospholipase [Alphaproteobacteria bacterium]